MKRFIFLATVMVAVGGFATAALAVPPGGNKGQSTRASQTLICKDAAFAEVFPCGLPGIIVGSPPPPGPGRATGIFPPGAGAYGTGNAFGQIKYDTSSAGGNETMHLVLHGLQANTWYLVTMQDPSPAPNDQFFTNEASCLFGVKGTSTGFEFCDVALVLTDDEGNVNALIPTDSGLTGPGSGAGVCTNSNVPALNPGPDLTGGTYTGITMVVKNVGVGG